MLGQKRVWISLFVSGAFLAFFVYRTNFREVGDAFSRADYALAFAAVPLYFLGFWIRTIRWRTLMRPVADVPTIRLYPVVLVGLMANNVLPARVGELVRAYLVGEREGINKSAALGTIAVDRVFDGLTLIAVLAGVAFFSGAGAAVRSTGEVTAVVFLGSALLLGVLAFSPDRARGWLLRFLVWLPTGIEHKIEGLLDNFLLGLRGMRSPALLGEAALLSVASWSVESLMYLIVGRAFGLHVGVEVYFLIAAAANLALSVIATPGGVGPFEAATQAVLLIYLGTSEPAKALAFAYAISLHILLLVPVILVGFAILWSSQLSLSDVLGTRTPKVVVAPPAIE